MVNPVIYQILCLSLQNNQVHLIFMIRFLPIFSTGLIFSSAALGQRLPQNPASQVGVESCRDCHEEMVEVWEKSAHARSFESLAASPASEKMAAILNIAPAAIPRSASCVRCHYTEEALSGVTQVTAGVSCEKAATLELRIGSTSTTVNRFPATRGWPLQRWPG